MRATTLLAVALLATVLAAPRAARCAGIARKSGGHGSLVLSIATVGARGTRLRELRTLLGLDREAAAYAAAEPAVDLPQFALAIARESSSLQLSVAPTYEKIGRGHSPGVALSGRF
ncbi:MAG: hypothetical protein ACXWLR_15185 [Myxococcales bacterium]